MCTVTIIPSKNNDFVLTSNRDESPVRKALLPDYYFINNTKMVFPKDEISGGTWIGVSEKNRVVCLLNGGFVIHKQKLLYKKSRGVVVLDFMEADDLIKTVNNYNFMDIEPFTMVIADWNLGLKMYELVWNGETKHFNQLPLAPRIWSSSTLYTEAMKEKRQDWFNSFKLENKLNANTLLDFHKTAGQGNDDYGVVMNRGFVKTTSITQIVKCSEDLLMRYENIDSQAVALKTMHIPQVVNG